ncbi:hypothetical protein D3C81_1605180 [compost metagenome]
MFPVPAVKSAKLMISTWILSPYSPAYFAITVGIEALVIVEINSVVNAVCNSSSFAMNTPESVFKASVATPPVPEWPVSARVTPPNAVVVSPFLIAARMPADATRRRINSPVVAATLSTTAVEITVAPIFTS